MGTPAKAQPLQLISKDTPLLIEFSGKAEAAKAIADNYTIDSREMFEIAVAQLEEIRSLEKKVEETRVSITGPLNTAFRNTNALFKPIADALTQAKKRLGAKMVAFEDAERARIRAAEEAAAAQQRREQAEAEAKLGDANAKLERGEMAPEEYAQVAGDVMAAAVSSQVGVIEAPPDRGGHARRDRFVADVTNLPDLLEYLAGRLRAGDPTFDNTVDIKIGQLNKFADATKGSVPIPGVTFRKDSNFAARSSSF